MRNSLHPEIDDFRMEQSAISGQKSEISDQLSATLDHLNTESEMLIALIRK
jgi:hypothetical protein